MKITELVTIPWINMNDIRSSDSIDVMENRNECDVIHNTDHAIIVHGEEDIPEDALRRDDDLGRLIDRALGL